jgi:hypothetical protein
VLLSLVFDGRTMIHVAGSHIPEGTRCQGMGLEKYERRCDTYVEEVIRGARSYCLAKTK